MYESFTNFSLYLRSNFEALGNSQKIGFDCEMESIEAYLALEQQNFGDRLNVEYDIECDDFLIPSLVENAVRHGIATRGNGAFCTTGETVGILYDGDPDKAAALRQLTMDMRDCLSEIGAQSLIVKKYGKLGIDMSRLSYEGSLDDIPDEFG